MIDRIGVVGLVNPKSFLDGAANKPKKNAKNVDPIGDLPDPDDEPLLEKFTESRLVSHIRRIWERNRRARLDIDDRLLYCLRARRGQYSQSELSSIVSSGGADPIYLRLTGTKCRAASAWIRDIVIPPGERPWALDPSIEPTFPPELSRLIRQEAMKEVAQLVQQGVIKPDAIGIFEFIQKVRRKVQERFQKDARMAADAMEDRIQENMEEGEWDKTMEGFIEDFVTYPTAFIKGPYYKQVQTLDWGPNHKPIIKKENKMFWSRVSPFDMYPPPHGRTLSDGDLIERIPMTREKLFSFIGVDGYDEVSIRHCLDNFEKGMLKDWIWEQFERERLETDSTYFVSEPDTIDALHYWGGVPGSVLIEWGMHEEGEIDPQKQYEIDAILIYDRVIRAVINDDPLGMRPYHHACWDQIPSSIWGLALPEQMEDHQKVVNAAGRSLCNNMAISAGPQIVAMVDQVAENEDITMIYPFKIWQMKSSMNNNNATKPVEFFQPSMNAEPLLEVLNTFEQKADDVTNVPRYSYGNEKVGGAGQTASGLSMLLNSAAKGIRRAISHIDSSIIRPSVYQSFVYLMLNDPDPTIKGSVTVVPKGAAALLIKEQMLVRVQTFMQQTANPIDMGIIGANGRRALLAEVVKLMDLPVKGIIPDDDEFAALQAQQQQMQQQAMKEAAMEKATIAGHGADAKALMQPQPAQVPAPPSPQASLLGNQLQGQQNSTQVNSGNVAQ